MGIFLKELCLYYMLQLCQPPVYSFFYLSLRINVTLGTAGETKDLEELNWWSIRRK